MNKEPLGASYNRITKCIIKDNYNAICVEYYVNYREGIQIMPSDNYIYCNNFIDNSYNLRYQYKLGKHITSPQYWNNETMGNYWSDYTGPDADRDGIGDIPYRLNENNVDYYPLWKPLKLEEEKESIQIVDYLTHNLELILLVCFIIFLAIAYYFSRKRKYHSQYYGVESGILFFMGLIIPFFIGLGAIFVFIFLNFPGISLADFINIFGDKLSLSLLTALFLFPMEGWVPWIAWAISGLVAGLICGRIFLPFISTYSISWIVLYLSWKELASILLLFKGLLLLNLFIALFTFGFGGWLGTSFREEY